MNLLLWNIYKGKKEVFLQTELKKLGKDIDLFLLQEVVTSPQMLNFWSSHFSHLNFEISKSFKLIGSDSHTGVGIGYKSKPQWIEYLKTQDREMFLFTPKSSIIAELDHDNKNFLIVCTHLLNFVPTAVFSKSLYQLAARVADYHGPMIFAGDFNTWNYKRYLILKNIMKDLKLEHVEFEDDQRTLKLDHLFIRDFDVLSTKLHSEIKGSDHLPIEAKLQFTTLKG